MKRGTGAVSLASLYSRGKGGGDCRDGPFGVQYSFEHEMCTKLSIMAST